MKQIIFILSLTGILLVGSNQVKAQLKVAENGNVGIQIGDETPISPLSVGSVGHINDFCLIRSDRKGGLSVIREGNNGYSGWLGSIGGTSIAYPSSTSIGVIGTVTTPAKLNSGRAWGILGQAGNSTSGYNYGVIGTTIGDQNGAGIVGTTQFNHDVYVPGIYAGYFVGHVSIVGNLNTSGTITGTILSNSDVRFKKNIAGLNSKENSVLKQVLQLEPVEYNLQQVYLESETITDADTAIVKQGYFKEKSPSFEKKHFGLIAQDVQKLYPDLVYEQDNGYLAINYVGLIPIMIQSIKELNAKVEVLEANKNEANTQLQNVIQNNQTAALAQNNPNPFSQTTEIRYYIPKDVKTAELYIYNMNGEQLKKMDISLREEGISVIKGAELNAGMYLYALVNDGKVIDTKRMILTK